MRPRPLPEVGQPSLCPRDNVNSGPVRGVERASLPLCSPATRRKEANGDPGARAHPVRGTNVKTGIVVGLIPVGLLAGCDSKPPAGAGAPLPPSKAVRGQAVTGRVVADPLPPRP